MCTQRRGGRRGPSLLIEPSTYNLYDLVEIVSLPLCIFGIFEIVVRVVEQDEFVRSGSTGGTGENVGVVCGVGDWHGLVACAVDGETVECPAAANPVGIEWVIEQVVSYADFLQGLGRGGKKKPDRNSHVGVSRKVLHVFSNGPFFELTYVLWSD